MKLLSSVWRRRKKCFVFATVLCCVCGFSLNQMHSKHFLEMQPEETKKNFRRYAVREAPWHWRIYLSLSAFSAFTKNNIMFAVGIFTYLFQWHFVHNELHYVTRQAIHLNVIHNEQRVNILQMSCQFFFSSQKLLFRTEQNGKQKQNRK